MDYRLVYHSANRLESDQDQKHAQIEQILEKSRRNNAQVGVTGALMFNAGHFIQVLEGPPAAVEATFERIQQDDRHGDVALIQFEPIAQRGFSNWSMAYVGSSPTDRLNGIGARSGFDPGKLDAETLFQRLRALLTQEQV